ncbi:MAG: sarcosine oxidase subunit delta [Chitinophagales bacterium]|nr:sarcosine oxidase subunit delta [Hyphomicrobiales bacterium]
MLIPCPHCGLRDHAEFTYSGDAGLKRPAPDANDETWFDYVYQRNNAPGEHVELWHHIFGCRQFIAVTRNMRTHVVSGSRFAATSEAES